MPFTSSIGYDKRLEPCGTCGLCICEVDGELKRACHEKIKPNMKVITISPEINVERVARLEQMLANHKGDCKGPCIVACPANADAQGYIKLIKDGEWKAAIKLIKEKLPLAASLGRVCPHPCESKCRRTHIDEAVSIQWLKRAAADKDLFSDDPYIPEILPETGKKVVVIGTEPVGGTANEAMCCIKGRFAHTFINHEDRLQNPMIKKDGVFEIVSWDEALDLIEEKLKDAKNEFGPDSIMGFSSAKVTNEENYLFQKFLRAGIGTNNIDHCARLCHASTVSGLAQTLGSGAMTNPLADVKNAELIFVTGSNTTETHPVMGAYIRQAKKNGSKLIVADPKRIPLCDIADIYLQIKPGTSVALANTMLHVIFEEHLEDEAYINAHTQGVEDLKDMVVKYTLEYGAEICGVEAELIQRAARMYAQSGSSYIAYAMGITQHLNGTHNVFSMSNMALATGNLGRLGTGINPLRGQSNVQGACDMGALPTDYPAYQKVFNPEIHAKFEKLWNTKLSDKVGYTVTEACDAIIEDKLKVLYIMGENPMVSDPDSAHVAHALEKAFVIVQDIFMTETAEYADVILPATTFAEKDGTFTNTERRVQRVRKALEPIGNCRSDWEILSELMRRFGLDANYKHPSEIFDELGLASPTYCGMDYERIDEDGMCWPCANKEHPGTPILHSNGPLIGKGVFKAIDWVPSPETQLKDYPITLMTGRLLEHYHTRTMTRRNEKIDEMHPSNYIEVNEKDAEKYGLKEENMATITSQRGSITARVVITDNVVQGTAFMPFHFGNGANVLTDGKRVDPIAKIPGFKQVGIKLEPCV